ncbi:response regulator receiver domain-containing protein [Kribbella sp. VKM Ac-2527]|uniref:Response regulator receiver domain-containing protein n=1 Tax=Kribbella caucasensis TaxID=2512215 RepID=A0A4R6KM87_9ACTN|nr:response regulator transcription factor [Kribbella sp. VKM Ac-2527]TDO52687.1 response regulator receiver domain-containing protein [Kribbella sp. VKM Ac-2527]
MADVRVLVVDDQEPFRRAIAAVVAETDGFVVVASSPSGEESLLSVARLRPDLVLMDVNLPGIDGIEATRRITLAADPPVVVLLSTYDQDEFDLSGCGAAAYLAKAAFGPDRLAAEWAAATSPPIHPEAPACRTRPPPAPTEARRRRPEC